MKHSMIAPEEFYDHNLKEYTGQLKELKRKSAYVSITRLAAFFFLAFAAYSYFNNPGPLLLGVVGISIIVFIILVKLSVSINDKRKLTSKLLFINQNEIDVIDYKDNAFGDGSDITDLPMHATDLDIFGKHSLYHLLNRTTTIHGKYALSHLLKNPLVIKEEIIAYQQAVKKLSGQGKALQLITANGLLQNQEDNNIEDIISWIESPGKMTGKPWLNILKFALPVVSVGGLLLYLSSDNPIPLGIGVILSWLLIGSFAKYTLQQHTLIGKKESVLQQYGTILKVFSASEEGESIVLKKLKHTSGIARHEILGLSKLSSLLDQRLNLLVSIFLNSFLLYDIHVMIALENWKRKNRKDFLLWIETVGDIEKLNSLAVFSYNNPAYNMPAILDEEPCVRALSIAHPLIPHKKQVANNINAGEHEKLLLITGSNMSGKSTFLRTIGVNILMAQCGLPVCATEFSFRPMHILSSIRINDSLQENTSYFMAELKRLKEIIDFLASEKPALVLIDEVLRGTNSVDKTYGSEELIRKLTHHNCLSFFASHDLSLSILENTLPGKVRNYCFESTIINDELLFDYKLHSGVATNKNASFLMHKMGIIG